MDVAVFSLHPQWEDFRQEVLGQSLTIGNVFEQAAFGGPEYGVNPAILLIAVGMRLDWQIPSDGDMFLRAEQAAREMHPHYVAFYTEESVREAYPSIGNAATYSLYRFFATDLSRLQEWCTTYQTMFGADYPLGP